MTESHPEIRDAVRALCKDFPGEYWRHCARARAYPTEFVQALTEAGWLAVVVAEAWSTGRRGVGGTSANHPQPGPVSDLLDVDRIQKELHAFTDPARI